MSMEILVLPAFGQGHLLPSLELCKHLASLNFKPHLVIFSNLYSFVPVSFIQNPLFEVVQIQSAPPSQSQFHLRMKDDQNQLALGLETLLSTRTQTNLPVCAIVDVLVILNWTVDIFRKFKVPTVGFFTSGACSAAMEHAIWKSNPNTIKPGDLFLLQGLPEEMALTESDLKRRPGGPHGGGGGGVGSSSSSPSGPRKMGPPNPGDRPQWIDSAEDSIALVINTCDELERPFIDYLANEMGKPVWGIGPLLPESYWKSAGSLVRDGESRSNRQSNVTEDEVIYWLDSKPQKSVLYVAFGSSTSPTMEEYPHLANALEEWTGPFIWAVQTSSGKDGYFPSGLQEKVGERGLIISGWAPQLLILSHPSTGGFLSHCGWNSTAEAIGRGVPFLAWPIRGDQYYNAKLVVSHLKIGYIVSDDMSKMVTKDNLTKGIERLMGDEEMKRRASIMSTKFEDGFPSTSLGSLDAFKNFIHQKNWLTC
ncbi:scopoletin glucosyltransferase isoform X3 [Jatropha curcas]|uniref:scopoletin glucosyltransferase isoform X1 n=1 Tax=Jatropha curcas TaxID=180498 RepID=UPI001893C34A|nr:scopoletin glucosyltransferase isoform X1 [Jatropha curcas]XP_037495807.1 scopoletin glucosyltransferase isoform X2 [Jatropha curcas]XP_037495808.1 scopoletin glucosyltransferase isoform X3 [Jatropha curcas]